MNPLSATAASVGAAMYILLLYNAVLLHIICVYIMYT
jgi:hypothetical protein